MRHILHYILYTSAFQLGLEYPYVNINGGLVSSFFDTTRVFNVNISFFGVTSRVLKFEDFVGKYHLVPYTMQEPS
jgi:hypothetical protein